jgi:hypothetical protein
MGLSAASGKAYLHRAQAIVVLTIVVYEIGISSRKIEICLALIDICQSSIE